MKFTFIHVGSLQRAGNVIETDQPNRLSQRVFVFVLTCKKTAASNITHTDTPEPDTVRCMSVSEDYLTRNRTGLELQRHCRLYLVVALTTFFITKMH